MTDDLRAALSPGVCPFCDKVLVPLKDGRFGCSITADRDGPRAALLSSEAPKDGVK